MNDWMSSLLLLTGLMPIVLIVLYTASGLVTALRMMGDRLKTRIISGRLVSVEKITDSAYSHVCRKAVFFSDEEQRAIVFKKMVLGPGLRRSGLLWFDRPYLLMVRGNVADQGSIEVLGLADENHLWCHRKDLRHICGLKWIKVFFAAFLGCVPGFIFVMPPLVERGYEVAPFWAALACGPLSGLTLSLLFRAATARFCRRIKEELETARRARPFEAGPGDESGRTLPLVIDNSQQKLTAFILMLLMGLAYWPAKWLVKGFVVMSSAFANPAFELRAFKISSCGVVRRDADDSVYIKDVVLQDPYSQVRKKIKTLYPAKNLIDGGLINVGAAGLWMIPSGRLGHPASEETTRKLKVAAYLENAYEAKGRVDLDSILRLYNYVPVLAPFLAALVGALAAFVALTDPAGAPLAPLDYLWLIPAAILPAFLMIWARRRISAAVRKTLPGKI